MGENTTWETSLFIVWCIFTLTLILSGIGLIGSILSLKLGNIFIMGVYTAITYWYWWTINGCRIRECRVVESK